MKISQMMERLEHIKRIHGDLEVMFSDSEGESVWSAESAEVEMVEDDNQYPKDWNMPKGFRYVEIRN